MDAPAFPRGRGDEPETKHKGGSSGSSSRPARPASSSHRLFAAKKEAPAGADSGKGADGKRRRAKSEGKRPAAAAAVAAAVEEAAASSHAAKRADELTFKVRAPAVGRCVGGDLRTLLARLCPRALSLTAVMRPLATRPCSACTRAR
jgi:hypothetical protein